MTRIEVALGASSYPVLIESGLLGRLSELLAPVVGSGRAVIVTDENVWAAQRGRLDARLSADPIVLPPGEGTKNWEHLSGLIDKLLEIGVERPDYIVAFGGGVIGDLAGFAAAVLKRGCGLVQVPTSLLAQVDSSVGGKTAINVPAGKNLVGAFHQPALVLIDPDCLETLPQRELRAGYAEIVKYGLIGDAGFFAWCEANGAAMLAGDRSARAHAIAISVAAKAAIVAADEREMSGRRALLNLGHTFGHALEAETGFSDRLLHGEAVATGLALAFRFSAARGHCAVQDAERARQVLTDAGLPASLAEAGVTAKGAELVAHMRHDKKAEGGQSPFVLAKGIGQAFLDRTVDLAEVAAFLDAER